MVTNEGKDEVSFCVSAALIKKTTTSTTARSRGTSFHTHTRPRTCTCTCTCTRTHTHIHLLHLPCFDLVFFQQRIHAIIYPESILQTGHHFFFRGLWLQCEPCLHSTFFGEGGGRVIYKKRTRINECNTHLSMHLFQQSLAQSIFLIQSLFFPPPHFFLK